MRGEGLPGIPDETLARNVKGNGSGDMSTVLMENQLFHGLNACRLLARRGCQARLERPSGVVVERNRRVIACWHWRDGGFELTQTDAPLPVGKVDTVAEALLITREQICAAS